MTVKSANSLLQKGTGMNRFQQKLLLHLPYRHSRYLMLFFRHPLVVARCRCTRHSDGILYQRHRSLLFVPVLPDTRSLHIGPGRHWVFSPVAHSANITLVLAGTSPPCYSFSSSSDLAPETTATRPPSATSAPVRDNLVNTSLNSSDI